MSATYLDPKKKKTKTQYPLTSTTVVKLKRPRPYKHQLTPADIRIEVGAQIFLMIGSGFLGFLLAKLVA